MEKKNQNLHFINKKIEIIFCLLLLLGGVENLNKFVTVFLKIWSALEMFFRGM